MEEESASSPDPEWVHLIQQGLYKTEDHTDDTDTAIAAGIFLYHLHYLHQFSVCPVCKDEKAYQDYYD